MANTSNAAVSMATAIVIGVCGVLTAIVLGLCSLYYCYIERDEEFDGDIVQYDIQEEYEAKINFEVLDSLDPSIRAGIDMDMLANMTNTDPTLLAKYRTTDAERRSSFKSNILLLPHTIQESLHRHSSLTTQAARKIQPRHRRLSDPHNSSTIASLSITMKAAGNESKGMFMVERKESQPNLLQILAIPPISTDLTTEMEVGVANTGERSLTEEEERVREEAANEEVSRWESAREAAREAAREDAREDVREEAREAAREEAREDAREAREAAREEAREAGVETAIKAAREAAREGETAREVVREAAREAAREEAREAGMEAARTATRKDTRKVVREVVREAVREAAREAARDAAAREEKQEEKKVVSILAGLETPV